MRKILYLLIILLLASCEALDDLFEKDEKACPILAIENVSTAVQEAVDNEFPGEQVLGWCESSQGVIAAFSDERLALFSEDGNLLKEGSDDDFEKSENCECEFGDDD